MPVAEKRVRVPHLLEMKAKGEPICMLTAYNYTFTRLIDDLVDIILVGDSLGNVELGYETTLPVTMEDMIHHTRAVSRARRHALLVADMPFLSFQGETAAAVENAGRLLKEGGADAVKLEGGEPVLEAVRRMSKIGIPVMGHLGLTPQSVHKFGGFKVQGRGEEAAVKLKTDALALEEAGAFALVLESIPAELAKEITASLTIPTIGIGAGVHCDGQVLVIYDMLGMFDDYVPKFVKRYGAIGEQIRQAVSAYSSEVRARQFPDDAHSYGASVPAALAKTKPEEVGH
ncbi:MAG TPA: 3-methyl-2-oxobutanoate hydroxymethyltransferase [Firmicutes bacterium]|nr:3-methyl-2-oxobutanoate hydroxymethyltransferase [Bacillota bacterium]